MDEKEWFLVGEERHFEALSGDNIWTIYDTLEAVCAAIEEVNQKRRRYDGRPIIGRVTTRNFIAERRSYAIGDEDWRVAQRIVERFR